MKTMLTALAVLFLAGCATPVSRAVTAPEPGKLVGLWEVTMYYSLTEPPSSTEMIITEAADGELTGSFYQSDFMAANYSVRNAILAFGAITTDGAAPYAHSGRLEDQDGEDVIEGQTLSSGRNFLMIWTARRKPAP